MVSVISGGKWRCENEIWIYEGTKKAKGMMVSEKIDYESLKIKIAEKLEIDLTRFDLKMSYMSLQNPHFPPFDICDKDDVEAYIFLNMTNCKDRVWPIALHSIVQPKSGVSKEKPKLVPK